MNHYEDWEEEERSRSEPDEDAEASPCSDIPTAINQEPEPFSDHKSVTCVNLNHFLSMAANWCS